MSLSTYQVGLPYFSKKVRIRVFCALILGLQEMMVQPNSR